MDVGQILGTATEPPRRESDPFKDDSEEFATYLSEPSSKPEPRAKKDSITTDEPKDELPGDGSVASENTAKQETAPGTDKPASATTNEESTFDKEVPTTASDGSDNTEIVVATPAATTIPAGPTASATEGKVNNQAAAANPAGTAATDDLTSSAPATQAAATNAAEQTKALQTDAAKKSELSGNDPKKPELNAAQSAIQVAASNKPDTTKPERSKVTASVAVTENPKPTPQAASEMKAVSAPSDALEKVRAEAAAKMSEKDVLSTKIAEMLQDGKGKISLQVNPQQQSFQSALASSTNLVTASLAGNPATTGLNLQPGLTGETEVTTTQVLPAVAANTQANQTDGMNQATLAAPTGSVQGVDATAANNASQAANAARASAHLPVAEQVSTQISAAVKEGQDRIKISLHPSELGRVEVKLDIGHDGRVLAVVSVDKQETLDLLQRDARSLERALQDAGFDTGSNSLNFGLRQDGQDGQGDNTNFAGFGHPLDDIPDETGTTNLSLQAQTGGMSDGGLDIQV